LPSVRTASRLRDVRTIQETLIERDAPRGEAAGSGFRLLVFEGDVVTSHALPRSGSAVLGRAEGAEVLVDLPPISRRHARFHIGAGLAVEDLGSSNGTRVRGQLLASGERAELRPGDTVELGSVLVLVQRDAGEGRAHRPRRVWSHDAFEARLEEECDRSEAELRPFALVRAILGGQGAAEVRGLLALLRPVDVVAHYGPGEYLVLLPGAGADAAGRLVGSVEGLGGRAGVALWPKDGRSGDALLEAASRALAPADAAESEGGIVIADPAMVKLHELLPRVARGEISVMIGGETGVGKEVFAARLHALSPRARGPYLRLNCGAFTESLLESELFGHQKGAFTGAVKDKVGLLESANGGSVFLDELGEMPLSVQAKLLRVIEQREVMRVGDVRPRKIDVRFIAATNRNLEEEVKAGRFRQDLYFRLNGISLLVPPLRERTAEIPELARAFAAQAARRMGKPAPQLTTESVQLLLRYGWPGNIRELKNVMERAVLLAPDAILSPEELPLEKMSSTLMPAKGPPDGPAAPAGRGDAEEEDRRRILGALEACAGNQTLAARSLGISRRTLINRLDAFGLPRPRKGRQTDAQD
jgi:two-component system response regulator AtoC